jgi:bis(5'-nucleosyl)-tetraphosphatase (symmetrical)
MAIYLIGDLRGSDEALENLLAHVDFSPSRDKLVALGDLVSIGPSSLAVVRRLQSLGDSAQCLLGSNDLYALAIAGGMHSANSNENLHGLSTSSDAPALLEWLRYRLIGWYEEEILMVSTGLPPQWDAIQAIAACAEFSWKLRQGDWKQWLQHMYEEKPGRWLDDSDCQRILMNALTHSLFCSSEGDMKFAANDDASDMPLGYVPWFDAPGRKTENITVAFSQRPALGLVNRANVIALDRGCLTTGHLSAMRVDGGRRELMQVSCQSRFSNH